MCTFSTNLLYPLSSGLTYNNTFAEAAGFEPADPRKRVGGLANPWFKPLTHTSKIIFKSLCPYCCLTPRVVIRDMFLLMLSQTSHREDDFHLQPTVYQSSPDTNHVNSCFYLNIVGMGRLERPTSCSQSTHSNQLNYIPLMTLWFLYCRDSRIRTDVLLIPIQAR